MEVLIMGPPGAGKGTQAKLLVNRYGLAHLATGDLLRKEVAAGSEIGGEARAYMARGDLVPDELINGMVHRYLLEHLKGDFLLDGYPRNIEQAHVVDAFLAKRGIHLDAVLSIKVADDVLVDRIISRISCGRCGAVFNLKTNPPSQDGICNACGEPLEGRQDDTEEKVRHRLQIYRDDTTPVVEHYRTCERLCEVDGLKPIEEVHGILVRHLEPLAARG